MLKKLLILLTIGILIGVGTGIYLWYLPSKKVEDSIGISITAAELTKAYATDEKAADAKYLNKAIKVTGVVKETEKNTDGGIMVILSTGDPTIDMQCALRDKGVSAIPGQTVVIKGFCSGNDGLTGVSLTDCVISK